MPKMAVAAGRKAGFSVSHRSAILGCAATLALTGFSAAVPLNAARAQDAASTDTTLEEIVVTARRREEKLQSVPIAITAFTAADIKDKNINSAQDLTVFVPSLIMNNNAGFGSGFSLRGQTA